MTYSARNLPSSIKVATHNYSMEAVDGSVMDDIGIYGDCNYALRRIRVSNDLPEANHAIEVVLHEIMHACYRAYHIEAERDEEYTVRNLSAALSGVLIENPELRKWIERASR